MTDLPSSGTNHRATREQRAHGTTVDPEEIAKFAAMAEDWWDPNGKFRPLHKLNPTRIAYIRDRALETFAGKANVPKPLKGHKILDIGCGGGLVSEPLARLGAQMTAIDATERNVGIASVHAEQSGLEIDYRFATAESLVAAGESFDLVLALEVVEHVADVPAFVAAVADLVRPGGGVVFSTLSRTPKAFLMAIVGAEYVMRWLPRGTHDWRRFLRPSELSAACRRSGLTIADISGMVYNPLADSWRLDRRDLDVNYLLFAHK